MTAFVFSFFFPFLLAMALVQWLMRILWKRPYGWRPTLMLGMVSALIVNIPFKGIPLGRWLISLNANFSIPLVAIFLSKVLEGGLGIRLLDRKALFGTRVFALTAGAALYPMALGLGSVDPYGLGWGFSWLFVSLLATTLGLLFIRNRFGIVLMGCVLCHNLHLLESQNLWDYLVDPFLVFMSGGVLGCRVMRKLTGGHRKKTSRQSHERVEKLHALVNFR